MKQELKPFYDEENDILYLAREGEESEFAEIQPGVALEFDETRQVIGIEIMQASRVLKEIITPLQKVAEGVGTLSPVESVDRLLSYEQMLQALDKLWQGNR